MVCKDIRMHAQLMIQQVEAVEATSRRLGRRRRGAGGGGNDYSPTMEEKISTNSFSSLPTTLSDKDDDDDDYRNNDTTTTDASLALADDLSTDSEENNDDDDEHDNDSPRAAVVALPLSPTSTIFSWKGSSPSHASRNKPSNAFGTTHASPNPSSFCLTPPSSRLHQEQEMARLRQALERCRQAVTQIEQNAQLKVVKLQLEIDSLRQQLSEAAPKKDETHNNNSSSTMMMNDNALQLQEENYKLRQENEQLQQDNLALRVVLSTKCPNGRTADKPSTRPVTMAATAAQSQQIMTCPDKQRQPGPSQQQEQAGKPQQTRSTALRQSARQLLLQQMVGRRDTRPRNKTTWTRSKAPRSQVTGDSRGNTQLDTFFLQEKSLSPSQVTLSTQSTESLSSWADESSYYIELADVPRGGDDDKRTL